MNDKARLLATLIIWGAFTLILITGIIGSMMIMMNAALDGPAAAIMVLVFVLLVVSVTSSTQAVWHAQAAKEPEPSTAKAKRQQRGRIERLVESLDDDDIYELEEMLLSRERHDEIRNSGIR